MKQGKDKYHDKIFIGDQVLCTWAVNDTVNHKKIIPEGAYAEISDILSDGLLHDCRIKLKNLYNCHDQKIEDPPDRWYSSKRFILRTQKFDPFYEQIKDL